jgi:hypothetical protein
MPIQRRKYTCWRGAEPVTFGSSFQTRGRRLEDSRQEADSESTLFVPIRNTREETSWRALRDLYAFVSDMYLEQRSNTNATACFATMTNRSSCPWKKRDNNMLIGVRKQTLMPTV